MFTTARTYALLSPNLNHAPSTASNYERQPKGTTVHSATQLPRKPRKMVRFHDEMVFEFYASVVKS